MERSWEKEMQAHSEISSFGDLENDDRVDWDGERKGRETDCSGSREREQVWTDWDWDAEMYDRQIIAGFKK